MLPLTDERPGFVEKEVWPEIDAWEEAEEIPRRVWQRMGELGLLGLEYQESGAGLSSSQWRRTSRRCRAPS